jgi:hypothetical protein
MSVFDIIFGPKLKNKEPGRQFPKWLEDPINNIGIIPKGTSTNIEEVDLDYTSRFRGFYHTSFDILPLETKRDWQMVADPYYEPINEN